MFYSILLYTCDLVIIREMRFEWADIRMSRFAFTFYTHIFVHITFRNVAVIVTRKYDHFLSIFELLASTGSRNSRYFVIYFVIYTYKYFAAQTRNIQRVYFIS